MPFTKLAICIDIIKVWFRIVICPLILSRSGLGLLSVPPDISTSITLIHKQIIAMAGYYACSAFFFSKTKQNRLCIAGI